MKISENKFIVKSSHKIYNFTLHRVYLIVKLNWNPKFQFNKYLLFVD